MDSKLARLLNISQDAHRPMPISDEDTAERRLLAKPVLASRMLDTMESLENWVAVTDYALLELSDDHALDGTRSIKVTCPTNLPGWLPGRSPGRIYAEPAAMRVFDREDWSAWNRLSIWIYPHVPGMKSLCLRLQLHNDGAHKVPDRYEREGAHNVSLEADRWNHVTVEIPHLHRDCVTGVSVDYDMCGHEPDAADQFIWYMDRLELQAVDCDVQEGWIPGPDRIAFSGSGYQPGQIKQAIAADLPADSFRLIQADTGKVVLEKPIDLSTGHTGQLQVLDFSEVNEEGRYLLAAGPVVSRSFAISSDVWASSIWKVLNFYLSQRCGVEVPGKHRACHSDLLLRHGDQAIVANGGWHDAADLAQGMGNTADGTAALLQLTLSLKDYDPRLYRRVLEEARVGLDYTLKVRFGDGYRSVYSSASIWTDGIIGTADDIISEPQANPYLNFVSAYAEAIGARVFAEDDQVFSQYCLKIAIEDFAFALLAWEDPKTADQFADVRHEPIKLAAAATAAAAELFRAGGDEQHLKLAARCARMVISCQQRQWTDWDIPMRGFFYQDHAHRLIWHHNHMSYAQYPLVGLESLCEQVPDHPDYLLWRSAISLNGEYLQRASQYTQPYGMLPAGIYHTDEAEHFAAMIQPMHPMMQIPDLAGYRNQVIRGIPLGSGFYLRCFPVWISFRGNTHVQMSESVNVAIAARLGNRFDLYSLHQQQLEWIVGKNPFAQSILYGEGYDHTQQYAVQPGQTIGQLPVGIQSLFDHDRPYWPQVNTATYKEVWIASANKWMWNMAYAYRPASITGHFPNKPGQPVVFNNLEDGTSYTRVPDAVSGKFNLELPAGHYQVSWNGQRRSMTCIAGRQYVLNAPLLNPSASATDDRKAVVAIDQETAARIVTVTLRADENLETSFTLRSLNLKGLPADVVLEANTRQTISAIIEKSDESWMILVLPQGNLQDAIELSGD